MSKRSERKGKETAQRYVKLDDEMTNSAAWDALSFGAIWVYIELRKKFDFENGGNSRLILPKREVLHRMKDMTFAKIKRELIKYGFIDCVDPGGLMKRPAIYRLSDRWEKISRDLVTTVGREAIRLGLMKRPLSNKYREKSLKNIQKEKKQDPEKKMIHRYILNNAPQKGA